MRCCLLLFNLFFCAILYGQFSVEGIVTDQQGEPLPFVNVLINGSASNGANTDIDGRFQLENETPIEQLLFSYVGFEDKILKGPFKSSLKIVLSSTAYEFEAVEIIAGENPAHRIIRNTVANRLVNDHEQMAAYECLTYNKMNIGFIPRTAELDSAFAKKDTTKEKVKKAYAQLKKAHQNFERHDLMLVESVSRRKFKFANDLQEEVLHNRVSGLRKLPVATLATDNQPFSFYEENINVFNKDFLSPISKGSTKKYFFDIKDTLFQNQDTVFIISFQPKKGKNFDGLKGVLYINTNQFAIQNVIAEPFDEGIVTFKMEQQYQWVNNEHWFPKQLNFEFAWGEIANNYMSFSGSGRTYVREVNLHPNFSEKTFQEGEELVFEEGAFETTDSIWNDYRVDSLTAREQTTYHVIDSISEAFKLEKWVDRLAALADGKFPLGGAVDLLLNNTVGITRHEKLRLGLGLATSPKLMDKVELGGYYAYGFADKEWKYGAYTKLFFDKYRFNYLELKYNKDIAVPAALDFQLRSDQFAARLFSDRIDNSRYRGLAFHNRPIKYFNTRISFGQYQFEPTYEYAFGIEEPTSIQTYTELSLGVRYAFNEKFTRFLGHNVFGGTNFPVLELNYTKGFNNFLGGDYDYSKFLFSIEHHFRSRQFGTTHYRIEAGYVNQDIPLNRLFAAPAFGNNASVQILSNSFRTMDAFEFLSDRFVHVYFRHDFGSLLFKTKKLRPKIILEHNIAFGSLRSPELHNGFDFKTLENGFFEGGLVLNDLIRINLIDLAYVGFGVGTFYRYGPNALDTFSENSRIQMTFTLSL